MPQRSRASRSGRSSLAFITRSFIFHGDEPVPEELWETVADYRDNDVRSTGGSTSGSYSGLQCIALFLAKLSGLTVNSTTQQHSTRIIFGTDRNPQSKFIYTDLATGNRIYARATPVSEHDAGDVAFEGYTFKFGKSEYRDEDPQRGGYVYAEPGMYQNVAVIDVASMHPTSIVNLNASSVHATKLLSYVDDCLTCN